MRQTISNICVPMPGHTDVLRSGVKPSTGGGGGSPPILDPLAGRLQGQAGCKGEQTRTRTPQTDMIISMRLVQKVRSTVAMVQLVRVG